MKVSKSLFLLLISIPLLIEAADWDYSDDGKYGPKNWGKVNAQCDGTVQSPIDYKSADVTFGKKIGEITLKGYGEPTPGSNVTLLNNGHTLQVGLYDRHAHNMSGGSLPGKFTFAQIHFHWGNSSTEGSEHIVDGKAYPLEIHFVHYNTKYKNLGEAVPKKDGLAVLGVFFKIDSADNEALKPVIDKANMIKEAGANTTISQFNLRNLMPKNIEDFYRNNGSLTTPPCSESVTWTVFKNVLTVSEKQLKVFRSLKDSKGKPILKNYRPILDINKRKIFATFSKPAPHPSTEVNTKPTSPHSGTQSLAAASVTAVLIAFVVLVLSY